MEGQERYSSCTQNVQVFPRGLPPRIFLVLHTLDVALNCIIVHVL